MALEGLARTLHKPFYLKHLLAAVDGLACKITRIWSVPLFEPIHPGTPPPVLCDRGGVSNRVLHRLTKNLQSRTLPESKYAVYEKRTGGRTGSFSLSGSRFLDKTGKEEQTRAGRFNRRIQ